MGVEYFAKGFNAAAIKKFKEQQQEREKRKRDPGDLPYFFKYDGGVGEQKKPEAEWGSHIRL
ncbi:hypothetical protein N7488_006819 [Penicillium malachiteum]|nr:hypothetical protein N7488_006819 [Penicillium malachiteum]